MDLRTSFLFPTAPRTTMAAFLIVMSFLATVPVTEAAPLSSLPSISSPTGILVAVLSVVVVLSLVVGLVFVTKKTSWVKKMTNMFSKKKRTEQDSEETEQPRDIHPEEISPPPFALANRVDQSRSDNDVVAIDFALFLHRWKSFTIEKKEDFIISMIKEFPDKVTADLAMDVLQTMLSEEVNTDLWMRMLRFTLMLERDLFYWYQPELELATGTSKSHPGVAHRRFQTFLVIEAEKILFKYGDVEQPNEGGEAGFMRFIAYLLGFVTKDRRILKLMEDTWTREGLVQTDASRAMVWGFRRWMDDPRTRDPNRPTTIESNGNHLTFDMLMRELRGTNPVLRPAEGSRAQHLLFALGCGDEPEGAEGPLAYMSDTNYPVTAHFEGFDYQWLMMGRDLMGNAWQWMCDKEKPNHDRMCDRFGNNSKLYRDVVDTVMKYEQDYYAEEGQSLKAGHYRLLRIRGREKSFATRYSAYVGYSIKFDEHYAWFERYQRAKKTIRDDINDWLIHDNRDRAGIRRPDESSRAVEYYKRLAVQWEEIEREGSCYRSQDGEQ